MAQPLTERLNTLRTSASPLTDRLGVTNASTDEIDLQNVADAAAESGALGQGFSRGIRGLKASAAEYYGLGNEALGADEAARQAYLYAHREQARGAAAAPDVPSWEASQSFGDYSRFAAGAMGNGIASMGPTMAAALAARALPISAGARFGATMAPMAVPMAGETAHALNTDPVARNLPASERFALSTGGGLGGAAAEALVPHVLAGGIGAKNFVPKLVGAHAGEGLSEVASSDVNRAIVDSVNPNRDTSQDNINRKEEFLGGFFGAAPVATPGAIAGQLMSSTQAAAGGVKDVVKDAAGATKDVAAKVLSKTAAARDHIDRKTALANEFGVADTVVDTAGEMVDGAADLTANLYKKSSDTLKEVGKKFNLNISRDTIGDVLRNLPEKMGKNITPEMMNEHTSFAHHVAGKIAADEQFAAEYPEYHAIVAEIANTSRENLINTADNPIGNKVGVALSAFRTMKAGERANAALDEALHKDGVYSKEELTVHKTVRGMLEAAGIGDKQALDRLPSQLVQAKGEKTKQILRRIGMDTPELVAAVTRTINDAFASENTATAVEAKTKVSDAIGVVAKEAMGDDIRASGLAKFLNLYMSAARDGKLNEAAKKSALKSLSEDFELGDTAKAVLERAAHAVASTTTDKNTFGNYLKAGMNEDGTKARSIDNEGRGLIFAALNRSKQPEAISLREHLMTLPREVRLAQLDKLEASMFTMLHNAEQGKLGRDTEAQYKELMQQADMAEKLGMGHGTEFRKRAEALRDAPVVDKLQVLFGKEAGSIGTKVLQLGKRNFREGQAKQDNSNAKFAGEDGRDVDINNPDHARELAEQVSDSEDGNWREQRNEEHTGTQGGVEMQPMGERMFGASDTNDTLPISRHPNIDNDNPSGEFAKRTAELTAKHADMRGGGRIDFHDPMQWARKRAAASGGKETVDDLLNKAADSLVNSWKTRKHELIQRLAKLKGNGRETTYASKQSSRKEGNLTTYTETRNERAVMKQEMDMIDALTNRYENSRDGRAFFEDSTAGGKDLVRSYGFISTGKAHGTTMEVDMRQLQDRYKASATDSGALKVHGTNGITASVDFPKMVADFVRMHENEGEGSTTGDVSRLALMQRAVHDALSSIMQMREIDSKKTFGEHSEKDWHTEGTATVDTGKGKIKGKGLRLPADFVIARDGKMEMTVRDLYPVEVKDVAFSEAEAKNLMKGGFNAEHAVRTAAAQLGLHVDGMSKLLAATLLDKSVDELRKHGHEVDLSMHDSQSVLHYGKDGDYSITVHELQSMDKAKAPSFDMLSDRVTAAEERVKAAVDRLARVTESDKRRVESINTDARDPVTHATTADMAREYVATVDAGYKPSDAQTAAYKKMQGQLLRSAEIKEATKAVTEAMSAEEWARGTVGEVTDSNNRTLGRDEKTAPHTYDAGEMAEFSASSIAKRGNVENSPAIPRGSDIPLTDKIAAGKSGEMVKDTSANSRDPRRYQMEQDDTAKADLNPALESKYTTPLKSSDFPVTKLDAENKPVPVEPHSAEGIMLSALRQALSEKHTPAPEYRSEARRQAEQAAVVNKQADRVPARETLTLPKKEAAAPVAKEAAIPDTTNMSRAATIKTFNEMKADMTTSERLAMAEKLSKQDTQASRLAANILRDGIADPFSKEGTASDRTDTTENRALVEARKATTLGDAVKTIFTETTNHSGRAFEEAGIKFIELSTFAKDPLATYNHEAWHTVESLLKGTTQGDGILSTVYKATSTPWMKKFLAEHFKDDAEVLKQLENERERAAFAFQLHASGVKLPLGNESMGAFAKIIAKIKSWAGFVDNAVRTGDFMKYVDKGGFLSDIKNPEAWLRAVGETRTEHYAKMVREVVKPLGEITTTIFTSTYDRMKDTGNEHYGKIADLYYGRNKTALGYIYKVQAELNARMNAMQSFMRPYDAAAQTDALSILRGVKGEYSVEGKELAATAQKFIDEAEGYSVGAGHAPRGNKLSDRLDYDMIYEHRAEFEQDLRSYGTHADKSTSATKKLVDTMLRDRNTTDTKLLFPNTPEGQEKLAKWQDASLVSTLASHVRHVVGAAEEARMNRTAKELYGTDINGLKAKGSIDASEAEIRVINDGIDAAHGKLGGHLSPAMRKITGGIIVAENIAILPFAIFSQLLDPLVLAQRKNSFSTVFEDLGRGITDSLRKGWSRDGLATDKWEKFAEHVGTIAQAQIVDSLGDLYSGVKLSGKMHKINNAFFRFNLMEQWNRSMHVAATKNAVEFIRTHSAYDEANPQHSKRFMEDLRLEKSDVAFDKDGEIVMNDKVRDAINQFVVESVVHPDAATNPLWMNDPHFALMAHMKRFTFAFSKFVLGRAQREVEHGNMFALAPLLVSVPWMMMADSLKGIAKEDVKGTHGITQSLMHGFQRAGLMGRAEFGYDALNAQQHGTSAIAGLLGPAAQDLDSAFRWAKGTKGEGA